MGVDGTYVGVLLDRSVLRAALSGRPSVEHLDVYRQFARQGVCFFTFAGLDTVRRRVQAYEFGPGGRLLKSERPLPRVIHYRSIALNPRDRHLSVALGRLPGYHVFNTPENPGKLQRCRWLAAEPSLRANVPESRRYEGAETLKALLASHRAIMLKPIWGSLGLGLIRVSHALDGGYLWETGTGAPRHCPTCAAIADAIRHLTDRRPYLAQQWLDMATYEGSHFDVRATVQKGGDGQWHLSEMTAKVGGSNPIATNVARGGQDVSLDRVLAASFGEEAQVCRDRLAQLGLRIARELARHEPGKADYGFDLCLTSDGHPWFIEANLRALRYPFEDAGDNDTWADTYRYPMEYAAYLAAHPKTASAGLWDTAPAKAT